MAEPHKTRALILLVDDDPRNFQALETYLAPDYRLRFADSGTKALELATTEEKPDLILLDLRMSEMDGLEVCRRFKADPTTRAIPVIFVTGSGDLEDEASGFAVGGVDFITRPTSRAIVRARVATHMALIHHQRLLEKTVEERTAALVLAESHWRMLMEVAPDAMIVVDSAGRIRMTNGQTGRFFGYDSEELIGQYIGLLVPERFSAGHAAKVENYFLAAHPRSMADGRDLTGRRKDGTEFPIDVALGVMDTAEGTMVLAAVRDTTVRKALELERKTLEAQLRHAQQMEAIGEMAAGIAHEVNTPTQYVSDNTLFLRDAFPSLLGHLATEGECLGRWAGFSGPVPPEEIATRLEQWKALDLDYFGEEIPLAIQQAQEGLARIAKIVGAMKDISHPGTEGKVPTDLNRAIESTLTVSRSAWKYVAELETALQPDLPPLPCYPGEFSQAILNLVVNAAHAIESRAEKILGTGMGRIWVSSRLAECHVEIRVADTGIGIPEELRTRIFEPFFTTKGVGKGTGQGLAITHSVIVERLGGSIEVESEVGRGTTFILRIPLKPKEAEAEPG